MNVALSVGLGLLARFLAVLAEHFAEWLFHRVSEGAAAASGLLEELMDFARWFWRNFAGGLCSRSRNLFHNDEGW